jgi:hypothetical protein
MVRRDDAHDAEMGRRGGGGKFGDRARICDECLQLCEEILAEPSPP